VSQQVLRDLLKRRPAMRVILMSATLDADMFNRYFGHAPSIKVWLPLDPARSHVPRRKAQVSHPARVRGDESSHCKTHAHTPTHMHAR
jgi:hypothetical protein